MRYQKPILEIAKRIFQNEGFVQQFVGKKLLLITGLYQVNVNNEEKFFHAEFQNFLDSIHCESSFFLLREVIPSVKSGGEFFGILDEVDKMFAVDSFDFIIVMDELEKTLRPVDIIAKLKNICRIGGSLLLLTRKPSREMSAGLGSNIDFYEDFWRFEEQDILNMFPEDEVQFLSNLEFPDDCDENGDTRSLFSQITVRTKSNPKTPPKIFNCRARCRVNFEDTNAIGYFHHGELNRFGIEEATDKSSFVHNYLDKYEFFLTPLRNQEFTLLELGVFYCGSLKMWKKFFPRAEIVGVDINENCKQYIEPRIQIETLDLSRIENLESLKKYSPRIIIDDASHIWSHQIKALSVLFTCLPSGGIYIIEDMETSFKNLYSAVFNDFQIDAYTFCELINRVVASKLKLNDLFDKSPVEGLELDGIKLEDVINEIGLQTEFAGIMKGACIFIKR